MINTMMNEKHNVIRGKRIADQLDSYTLFEQSTYSELERNVLNFTPTSTKRQNAVDPVRLVSLTTLPFIGTKNINVEGLAESGGKKYTTHLIFNNIEFETEDTADNITVIAKDSTEYHMKAIDLNKHTVRVRCNCLDFMWRFAPFNAKDKSLVGRVGKPFVPYQSKTERGPVNPQEVPGVCKHLIATVKAMKHSGMLR